MKNYDLSKFLVKAPSIRPDILLHPNIPKPMHGMAPRVIMGKDWWNKERNLAYKRANYCCMACGINKYNAKYHQWLEAHEFYDIDYNKGRMVYKETVALCHSCHNFIHSGRMEILVKKGEMKKEKMLEILEHGIKLTEKLQSPPLIKYCAPWGKWRLVYEGKEYPGKFKSFEEWFRSYNPGKPLPEEIEYEENEEIEF